MERFFTFSQVFKELSISKNKILSFSKQIMYVVVHESTLYLCSLHKKSSVYQVSADTAANEQHKNIKLS